LPGPNPAKTFDAVKTKAQCAENKVHPVMDHPIQTQMGEPFVKSWTALPALAAVTSRHPSRCIGFHPPLIATRRISRKIVAGLITHLTCTSAPLGMTLDIVNTGFSRTTRYADTLDVKSVSAD
jgi:hypothetical protein